MASELARDHPALRAPSPADLPQARSGTQARALLAQGLVLPILDGLDELPEDLRARALHAINQALPARQPLVLSSRTAEYRRALTTPVGVTVLLNGAAGIRLLPLDATKAAAYLERDAGGPSRKAAARWRRVTAALGTTAPVSQALSTPLGLFLARTIYNPRPDEQSSALPDPDELLDQARFPTRQDIDTHLFTAFIPAAYRPASDQPTPWSAQEAQRTLTFLARHLQNNLDGTPNLAWWQLPKAFPTYRRALAVGIAVLIVVGFPVGLVALLVSGVVSGFGVGLGVGLPCAVMAAFITVAARDRNPSSGLRWSWRGKSWLTFGLPFGLASGGYFGYAVGINSGLWFGLLAGLPCGLPFALMGGLRSVHPDLSKAVGPGVVLGRDRRTLSAITFTVGILGALAFGLYDLAIGYSTRYWGQVTANRAVTLSVAYGLTSGLTVGLMLALARSVWMQFLVARTALAGAGRVPWRFMGFLADAHERRGVLRQVGAVYQFRHLDLQGHLAQHQP